TPLPCKLNSLRLHPDRQPTGVQRALAHFRGNTPLFAKKAVCDDDPNLNPGPKLDQPDMQPTGA
ncbi:hypothetical protein DPMN_190509, partial [Dreissena polymorpha]